MHELKLMHLKDVEEIGLTLHGKKIFPDERGEMTVDFEGEIDSGEISLKRSFSNESVGRGLHLQVGENAQEKIVTVTSGRILDVVVDMNSPVKTFYAFEVSGKHGTSIKIPKRFAHGFITLEPTEFLYISLGKYDEGSERTLNALPSIAKTLGLEEPLLSKKDRSSDQIKVIGSAV